ncbi:hypothetical protein E2C01_075788 [Portunus trituberculatus]|uniref:Uncharacterized protein n=1 Tax=Portunus trituberculatus TaxID=210409 RepID=A0A5B7IBJ2_PORTR|nr:hypothetical protein [Portunus trituberculatus]
MVLKGLTIDHSNFFNPFSTMTHFHIHSVHSYHTIYLLLYLYTPNIQIVSIEIAQLPSICYSINLHRHMEITPNL